MEDIAERIKEWFFHFCEATEHKARISLLVAASMVIVMFGSVCAVNASAEAVAREAATEESIDMDTVVAYQDYLDDLEESSSAAANTSATEATTQTSQYDEITRETKSGELAGGIVVSELASLSDDELVEEITSGNAGVIAREQIATNTANDVNAGHTASVAAEPEAEAAPTPAATSSEASQTTVASLNYELGIDVSRYNGDIDWNQVKAAGYAFAIIRCGGRGYGAAGGLYTDTKFTQNIQGAKAAGMKVGVYFFSQATTAYEALEEASLTLSQIKGYSLDYPVVMDWETDANYRTWTLGSEAFANVITSFCSTIAQNGYTPMVYLNTSDITSRLGSYSSQILANYKLWYALPYTNYKDKSKYQPGSPTPSKGFSYSMWQYSWWGQVPGISYPVDLNLSYLGSTSLSDAKITLTNTTYNTTVGTTIAPMNGVTCTNSLGKSDSAAVTCKITDSAGTEVTADVAAITAGIYTITYSYTDAYKGLITASATWTVAATTETTVASETTTPSSDAASTTTVASTPSDTATAQTPAV